MAISLSHLKDSLEKRSDVFEIAKKHGLLYHNGHWFVHGRNCKIYYNANIHWQEQCKMQSLIGGEVKLSWPKASIINNDGMVVTSMTIPMNKKFIVEFEIDAPHKNVDLPTRVMVFDENDRVHNLFTMITEVIGQFYDKP